MVAEALASGHRVVLRVSYSLPQPKASAWMLRIARMMLGQCFDDGSVLGNQVHELHGAAVDAAETSQRREVQVSQDGEEKFYWELVELADGITRGDGHVGMSPVVKRTPCFQLRIIEGIVADVLFL